MIQILNKQRTPFCSRTRIAEAFLSDPRHNPAGHHKREAAKPGRLPFPSSGSLHYTLFSAGHKSDIARQYATFNDIVRRNLQFFDSVFSAVLYPANHRERNFFHLLKQRHDLPPCRSDHIWPVPFNLLVNLYKNQGVILSRLPNRRKLKNTEARFDLSRYFSPFQQAFCKNNNHIRVRAWHRVLSIVLYPFRTLWSIKRWTYNFSWNQRFYMV